MAISSLDTLIAGFAPSPKSFYKLNFAPQLSGAWIALFLSQGVPGWGSVPTPGVNGEIPTAATTGAFAFSPSGSTYLSRLAVYGSVIGTLYLYDRLWHNSGLSVTSTSPQAMSPPALTRPDANGDDVEAWLDVYTALGAGATAKTISYTNQSGLAGRTGNLTTFVATAGLNRAFPFTLLDRGVRSIESFNNVATSTSGSFGLVLRRAVASLPVSVASAGNVVDAIGCGLPRVYDNACLELLWLASAGTTMTIYGNLSLAQG